MKKLSSKDLASRREFDFLVMRKMSCGDGKYMFSAHRTAQDAAKGRRLIEDESEARYALHYRADYRVRTLVGPGRYSDCTIIRIDLSSPRYPFAEPTAWIVETKESKTPWSPHFARGLPVCIGSLWRKDGNVLLGHLLIHLAKLLNWDEHLAENYGGYNPKAISWWRSQLGRPLDPEISYPTLPVDELYAGDVRVSGGFQALSLNAANAKGGFRKL